MQCQYKYGNKMERLAQDRGNAIDVDGTGPIRWANLEGGLYLAMNVFRLMAIKI